MTKKKEPKPEFVDIDGRIVGFCKKTCPFFLKVDYPEHMRCELTQRNGTGLYSVICLPWLLKLLDKIEEVYDGR